MNSLLMDILSIQSYSGQEDLMMEFIKEKVKEFGCEVFEDKRNIYVTKGYPLENGYPCIVSHTDTVHKIVPKNEYRVIHDKEDDIVFAYNPVKKSFTGVGGDDKNGIYIALCMLKDLPSCKAAFFHSEEMGTIGSREADMDFFKDILYVLQCDRRGNSDFITDISGPLSSQEFQDDIKDTITSFGYSFMNGMTTDVGALASKNIGVSVANMSCGYYNPHCDDEIIVMTDLNNTLDMVSTLMMSLTKKYSFTRPEPTYVYHGGYGRYKGAKYASKEGRSYGDGYGYLDGYDYDDFYEGVNGKAYYGGYGKVGANKKDKNAKHKASLPKTTPLVDTLPFDEDDLDALYRGDHLKNEELYLHFLLIMLGWEPIYEQVYMYPSADPEYKFLSEFKVSEVTMQLGALEVNSAWDQATDIKEERKITKALTWSDDNLSRKSVDVLQTCWGCTDSFPISELKGPQQLCNTCTKTLTEGI